MNNVNPEKLPQAEVPYLAARGITPDTISAYHVEIIIKPTLDSAPFRERLGFDTWDGKPLTQLVNETIWFPCHDAEGKRISWIARLIPELDEAKFLTPKGHQPFPFIPRESWDVKDKSHKPVIITEGPVKALAVVQAGGLPIGLGGVWMALSKNGDRKDLIDALKVFHWKGRNVYLALDQDSSNNPQVRQALLTTALVLRCAEAIVRCLRWSLSEGKGIDDYLANKVRSETSSNTKLLEHLIEHAVPIEDLLSPEDLPMVERVLRSVDLSPAMLEQVSRCLGPKLNVRPATLQDSVSVKPPEGQARPFDLNDPDPWTEQVDGAELLNNIASVVRRYVVLNESDAAAIALWILLTFCEQYVDVLPLLAITSPQKRCGKTTLLSILARLVRRPLPASSISPAALFRSVEKWIPTLLIDEADAFLKDNEELRGILNAGHTRGSYILRSNPVTFEPERFSTWAPKAIAGIKQLPETLMDRSIHIALQRRGRGERIEKLRDADPLEFDRLRRQAFRWALDNGEQVQKIRPKVPEILNDRAGDNWFALLGIATIAKGDWSKKAVSAALALSANESDDNIQILVLSEVQRIFREESEEVLTTEEIITSLNKNEEAPWADWNKRMTAKKLGGILKGFRVETRRHRKDGNQKRGYAMEELKPVFDRYLATPTPENEPQSVTRTADQVPEPLNGVTHLKVNPSRRHMKNPMRHTVKADEQRIGEECDTLNAKIVGKGVVKGVETGNTGNSVHDHSDAQSAGALVLGKGIFNATPCTVDQKDGDSDSNSAQLRQAVIPPAANERNINQIEARMLSALCPYDYEGGLSNEDWLKKSGVPERIFSQKCAYLTRRGGPVYKSKLTGNYQLSPFYADRLQN